MVVIGKWSSKQTGRVNRVVVKQASTVIVSSLYRQEVFMSRIPIYLSNFHAEKLFSKFSRRLDEIKTTTAPRVFQCC